ncbi:MAG: OmpA family protein [Rhodospirillaceae bacterium]
MTYSKFQATVKRALALAACGVVVSACSSVPDAVNPVEWYNSTVSYFSDDKAKEEAQKADPNAKDKQSALVKDAGKAPPGAGQPFPKLSRVDSQAEYEAAKKRSGLVADVQGRQYAPAIARQGEPSSQLAAAPPEPPKPSGQPVAPGQPVVPVVTSTEMAAGSMVGGPAAGGGLPTTAEQQAFEARLRKQLAEIRARAGQPGPALPLGDATQALNTDEFGTVVVSAGGIEAGQSTATMAMPPSAAEGASQGGDLAFMARGQNPLSPGAVRVATIQFANGSAHLTAEDRRILANVRQLQKERGGRIHIVGHASSRTRPMDPVQHKMVNLKVSVDRANMIAEELMRLGFAKEQIVVDAVSDAEPLYHEFMPTGEAGNRRAEIYLES